jgi:natural product precursor
MKMKKLNILKFNSEKLLKTKELTSLRGGTNHPCTCDCVSYFPLTHWGYLVSETGDCYGDCAIAFGWQVHGSCAGGY